MNFSDYIVYRTENMVNGKFYYGVLKTSTRVAKSYLGSGKLLKKAIAKYGRENFVRRTVKEFDNREDAYAFEKLIVDDLLLKNPDCYNLKKGGEGGSKPGHRLGNIPWNKGKTQSDELKEKVSLTLKEHYKGKKMPWNVKVMNTETGEVYNSIEQAANDYGLASKNLSRYLNGTRRNKTNLIKVYELQ